MRHFFDLSDVRDIERADAERGGAPRNADTYAERKGWRRELLGRDDADRKVVR